jgi:Na+/melibiose symporter-like transporter
VSFVEVSLRLDASAAATVPATIFVASLAAAFLLKRAAAALGRRTLLAGGAVSFVGACVAVSFVPAGALGVLIFPVVAFIGIGAATATVSVATLQSDLLGADTASAAFVFGCMSFVDKLFAGVIILGLQIASDATRDTPQFFRTIQSAVPSAAMAAAVALALTTKALRAAPQKAAPPAVAVANPAAAALAAGGGSGGAGAADAPPAARVVWGGV